MAFVRVIRTGDIIEIYEYETILALQKDIEKSSKEVENEKEEKGSNEDQKEEKRKLYDRQSSNRARQNIRRLITMNFNDGDTFITLTFAENMTDVNKANYELKKFVQKMKRKQSDFKHVTVLEFQKRGAVHYHMICNYRHNININNDQERKAHERLLFGEIVDKKYIPGKLWKNGIGNLKNIKGVDNVGAYVIKYMTKGERDERLFGQKSYFSGGNLERPVFLDHEETIKYYNSFEGVYPTFTSEYETEYTGKVFYREYNLKRMENEKA